MDQVYYYNNDRFIAYNQHQSLKKDSYWVIFLHGMMSDINGSKATYLHQFCQNHELNYLAFDNYGHGKSSGKFIDQTISTWLEGVSTIINFIQSENIILVGSSLGGWLALLAQMQLSKKIKGIICLAPAIDFTENCIWNNLTSQEQSILQKRGSLDITCKDKNHKYSISYNLINDAKQYLLLNQPTIPISCPIHCVHGMQDLEVPYSISNQIIERVSSNHAVLKLIKYAGHSLSNSNSLNIISNSILEILDTDM